MSDKTCERDDCEAEAVTYFRYGMTVSNGPFNATTSGAASLEQPIDLCSAHALEAFGVSFT